MQNCPDLERRAKEVFINTQGHDVTVTPNEELLRIVPNACEQSKYSMANSRMRYMQITFFYRILQSEVRSSTVEKQTYFCNIIFFVSTNPPA